MRGGDDPHIHGHSTACTHRAHLALLQHTQELDLKGRRCVAYFIEKDGAAIGALEKTNVVFERARKGAPLMAEQLGFEQRVGHGGAVFQHESALGTRAGVVNGTRQQFLAGARLAGDEHCEVVARHACGHFADGVQWTARRSHQAIELESRPRRSQRGVGALAQHRCTGAQLQVQTLGLHLQAARLGRPRDRGEQVLGHPGLEHVLVDAGVIDARNDVLRVGVARDDDAHGVGPDFADLFEKFHTAGARHALVAQDHADFMAFEQATRLVGAGGGEDAEVFLQVAANGIERTGFVVHHQHQRQAVVLAARVRRIHAVASVGKGAASRCGARWRGVQAWGLR